MPEDLIETVRREIRDRLRERDERLRTTQDEQRIEARCPHGGKLGRCVVCQHTPK